MIKRRLQRFRVTLGFLAAIVFLACASPTWQTIAIGGFVAFWGVAIRACAAGHLRKNASLATSGPYAHTRNPLYLGSLIIALGVVICGGSWWFIALLLIAYPAVYLPVMQAEATHMHRLFPQEFPEYEKNVPLFLPRLTAWRHNAEHFDRNLYFKYREYQALIGLSVIMGVLIAKTLLHSH